MIHFTFRQRPFDVSMEHSPQETSKSLMSSQPAIAMVVFVGVLVMFVAMRIGSSALEADLPTARLESLDIGWVDEKRCAECHEEAETFWETGHANTLRPASDPDFERQLRRSLLPW
jgi:hypothetical protein